MEKIKLCAPAKGSLSDLNLHCSVASGMLWDCGGFVDLIRFDWQTAETIFQLHGNLEALEKAAKYLISKGWKKEGL